MERNQTEFIYPSIYLSIYPPTYAINLLIIDLLTNGSPFGWRVLLRRSPIYIYIYIYTLPQTHKHKTRLAGGCSDRHQNRVYL